MSTLADRPENAVVGRRAAGVAFLWLMACAFAVKQAR